MENACLNDQQKSAIAERLAVAEHCLLEGADEYLQVNLSFPEPCVLWQILDSGDGSGHFHDENAGNGVEIRGGGGKQRFIGDHQSQVCETIGDFLGSDICTWAWTFDFLWTNMCIWYGMEIIWKQETWYYVCFEHYNL